MNGRRLSARDRRTQPVTGDGRLAENGSRTPAPKTAPKRTSLREMHKQESRRRLVEAGQAVFEENGFLSTSVEMITNAAGASRGTFYLHFNSTAEVLVEAFTHAHINHVLTLFDDFAAMEALTPAALRDWIGRYIGLYEDTKLIMRAFLQGQSRGGQDVLNTADEVLEGFLNAIVVKISVVREKAGHKAAPKDDKMRALLMWAQLERLCYYWFIRGQETIDRARAAAMISDSWIALLEGDRPSVARKA